MGKDREELETVQRARRGLRATAQVSLELDCKTFS